MLSALEAGDHPRPAVVLIHGYPDTKTMWAPVLARLSARLHVLAYDVRGAGSSGVPRTLAGFDLAQLGEDLIAVIDALAAGRRVHVVGHDWGGLQGWEFATQPRFAERLRSFTAIAAPSLDQVALLARGKAGGPLGRLWQARRSWYIAPLLVPGGPQVMWRVLGQARWRWQLEHVDGVPVTPDYPAATLTRDAIQGAGLYRQNMPRRMARPRREPMARVPVQLIIPTRDRYIPTGYYDLADRFAPGLRRRLVDAPHWLPRSDPELVAAAIASFVEDIEPG